MAFTDIKFIERFKLSFFKKDWTESDIDLIRSMGFKVKGQIIIVDLTITCKRALFEFIKTCFSNIADDINYKNVRDYIYGQLKIRYSELHIHFNEKYLKKLSYYSTLYKHQLESIYFSASRKYSLLSLEQGLGKTITAASVSLCLDFKKTLIICPAIAKYNWLRDLTSDVWGFHPMEFTILDSIPSRGVKAFREKFVVINFDILEKYNAYLTSVSFDHIIIDEIQNCKNISTRKAKNTWSLIKHHKEAKVTMLSGTPIKNRINDVFSYLKMSEHNIGKNYSKFLREYTHYTSSRFGKKISGGKNLDTLYKHLSNFIIRKTEKECLDLPDKIVNKYFFKLDEFKTEYDAAIEEACKSRELSQIHSSLHTLNIITIKSKIKGIIELAEEVIEQGRKPVIFSSYNEPLNVLQEHFKERCVRIDGSVDSFDRDKYITRFKEDSTCEVFIGNMIAAGVAINLTNSSDVIFTNFPFVPTDVDQAIARCFRLGQKERVKVYFTIATETIDEMLFDLITDKAQDINALINRNNHSFEYSNIQDKLFSKLLEDYKKKNLSLSCTSV